RSTSLDASSRRRITASREEISPFEFAYTPEQQELHGTGQPRRKNSSASPLSGRPPPPPARNPAQSPQGRARGHAIPVFVLSRRHPRPHRHHLQSGKNHVDRRIRG